MVALLVPRLMPESPSKSEMQPFSWWFRHQLTVRGWSQSDFARRAGIAPGQVSNWATGVRNPGLPSAQLIADTLGVDVDVVLTRLGLDPVSARPADERVETLISELRNIEATPDRIAALEATIRTWADMDRKRHDR